MPRLKTTPDPLVAADIAALRRLRKTAELDFIKWTDDDSSFACVIPGRKNQGRHATLHSLRYRQLADLPAEVRSRPLAGAEFTIDLRADPHLDLDKQFDCLADGFDVLARRLAPQGPDYRVGVYRQNPRSGEWARQEIGCASYISVNRRDEVPLREISVDRAPRRPMLLRSGRLRAETVWFGHEVEDSWADFQGVKAQHQVRLYLKATDNGRDLPRSEWRVRVEVTINGTALRERHGLTRVENLLNGSFARLMKPYLQLCRPISPARDQRAALKRTADTPLAHLLLRQRLTTTNRAEALGKELGNIAALAGSLIEFRSIPQLTKLLMTPAYDFHRGAPG